MPLFPSGKRPSLGLHLQAKLRQGGSEAGPWSARKLWNLATAGLEAKHLGGAVGPWHHGLCLRWGKTRWPKVSYIYIDLYYTYIFIFIYMQMHVYMYIHMYIPMYVYIYIHTYIQIIYIYIYVLYCIIYMYCIIYICV